MKRIELKVMEGLGRVGGKLGEGLKKLERFALKVNIKLDEDETFVMEPHQVDVFQKLNHAIGMEVLFDFTDGLITEDEMKAIDKMLVTFNNEYLVEYYQESIAKYGV